MTISKDALHEAVFCSKAKVERAKQHIDGIKFFVERIASENTNPIVIEFNPDSAVSRIFIGPAQFLPLDLPLWMGDAIHNLNVVTDYLWSGLARSCGAADITRVSFPRHESRQHLEASLDKPRGADVAIHQAFPQAKGFVLDLVKPYNREDAISFIWHLNKLDNVNKHRLLLAATHLVGFSERIVFEGGDGSTFGIAEGAMLQTQGDPLVVGLAPPVKIQNDPKAIIDVVFAEPAHFSGEPVLETLVNCTRATTEVIEAFEKSFL